DAGDRLARAIARIDGHIETLGFEIALVERQRERRSRTLEAPVEGELQGRLRARAGGGGTKDGGANEPGNGAPVDELDHVCSPCAGPVAVLSAGPGGAGGPSLGESSACAPFGVR